MRLFTCVLSFAFIGVATELHPIPSGWQTGAPRDEIKPAFSYNPNNGLNGSAAFAIESDGRKGLDGFWYKSFPVEGGKHFAFRAYRRVSQADFPQQSTSVRIRWQDEAGKQVEDDRKLVDGYLLNFKAWAPPEFPQETGREMSGWAEVAATYQAPSRARKAVVELHLQWAPQGRVEWSNVEFKQVDAPEPRIVRLATVHYRPAQGQTAEEKRTQYAPFIAEAARQKAQLVVLGETLTYFGAKKSPAEVAEPVPGPSTEYFGELARKNKIYIVAGLYERDEHLVYNVAVLLSPEGKLAGKYRKVTLPWSEVDSGVAPGTEYPVFETSFGKLGIMICYDGFFPEVSRELRKRGAEVIAWPVWGFYPEMAGVRAFDNHVYLVSSTYEDVSRNWGRSAIWGRDGRVLSETKDWGTVTVAEVDLNEVTRWRSLGDFRSKLPRHVPVIPPATTYK